MRRRYASILVWPTSVLDSFSPLRTLLSAQRQIYEKLRNMLKCSVCESRFKNTVIVRCGHLFCDECVEGSLRSRNRKCPACKERFGQDDVRRVYLS